MRSLTNVLRTILSTVLSLAKPERCWEDLEYFDESWRKRIEEMARHIAPGESVMDLGCGRMWLKEFLKDNTYYPIDYKARDGETLVINFNKHEYPDRKVDVAVVSGTLEYIKDYSWFVRQMSLGCKRCIVSYCTTESYPDIGSRKRKAWKNHLSRAAVIELFANNGMDLVSEKAGVLNNHVFAFSRRDRLMGTNANQCISEILPENGGTSQLPGG